MLCKRYGEILLRLEELGARAGKLNNRERQELRHLLEEQAWLGEVVLKQARSVLEDIDKSVDKLFEWMIQVSDIIDRAAGEEGTPEDVLRLAKVVREAGEIKKHLRRLHPAGDEASGQARREALPAAPPVEITPAGGKENKQYRPPKEFIEALAAKMVPVVYPRYVNVLEDTSVAVLPPSLAQAPRRR